MQKTDRKLAEMDAAIDRTSVDVVIGTELKALARQVAIAAVQDLAQAARNVKEGTNSADPHAVKTIQAILEPMGKTPSGLKIISYGKENAN